MNFCKVCFATVVNYPLTGVGTRLGVIHTKCFICSICRCSLYRTGYETRYNQLYCPQHYVTCVTSQCYGCAGNVTQGDTFVVSHHKAFHSQCLKCDVCKIDLMDKPHTKTGPLFVCYVCKPEADRRLLLDKHSNLT